LILIFVVLQNYNISNTIVMSFETDLKTRKQSKKTSRDKKEGNTGKYSSRHVRYITNILDTRETKNIVSCNN